MVLSPFIYKNGDKKKGNQLGSYTTQFKLTVPDGKNEFQFAMAQFLPEKLRKIKAMPETNFDCIVEKYNEMKDIDYSYYYEEAE